MGGPFWARKDAAGVDDPQGRARRRREPAGCCAARVRGRDRRCGEHRRTGRPRRGAPVERQIGQSVGGRGRPRRCDRGQQHVRDGVAAEVRTVAGLSRTRPVRLVRRGTRRREDRRGPATVPRPSRGPRARSVRHRTAPTRSAPRQFRKAGRNRRRSARWDAGGADRQGSTDVGTATTRARSHSPSALACASWRVDAATPSWRSPRITKLSARRFG